MELWLPHFISGAAGMGFLTILSRQPTQEMKRPPCNPTLCPFIFSSNQLQIILARLFWKSLSQLGIQKRDFCLRGMSRYFDCFSLGLLFGIHLTRLPVFQIQMFPPRSSTLSPIWQVLALLYVTGGLPALILARSWPQSPLEMAIDTQHFASYGWILPWPHAIGVCTLSPSLSLYSSALPSFAMLFFLLFLLQMACMISWCCWNAVRETRGSLLASLVSSAGF